MNWVIIRLGHQVLRFLSPGNCENDVALEGPGIVCVSDLAGSEQWMYGPYLTVRQTPGLLIIKSTQPAPPSLFLEQSSVYQLFWVNTRPHLNTFISVFQVLNTLYDLLR